MEPDPGDWSGESEGRYDAARLRDIHAAVQDDHWALADENIDDLLKDPPSDDLRQLMFDEDTRCPPPIKSAIILDATMRGYGDVLPDVDVPSLVCAGADETWRSVAAVQQAADLLPEARFELFTESGHVLTLEEPDRFNDVLRAFVASV